jgi:hypothetical protein
MTDTSTFHCAVKGLGLVVSLAVFLASWNLGQAADLTYPDDFAEGTTLQQSIDDAGISTGETLTVTGPGPYKGFNNARALVIIGDANGDGSGAKVLIQASTDADFICPDNDCPLVLNHQGGTVENFTFEVSGGGVTNCHRLAFAGDNGGTWRNCTFRITDTWPCEMNAFDVTGGDESTPAIVVEDCVMEQTASNFSEVGDSALIRVSDNHHPVFNNCAIRGRGRDDRKAVLLINASATFNDGLFDNNANTQATIFIEGNGQVCNLNDCDFVNPGANYRLFILYLGGGGEPGPCTFNASRCKFADPIGTAYPQTRALIHQRNEGVANFESCWFHWDAALAQPDGYMLFENSSNSSLTLRHCTAVDTGPLRNGRFFQVQGLVEGCTLTMENSIFDGLVAGETGSGLVYKPSGEDPTYVSESNIRYDITTISDERGMREGMDGFTFEDPLLRGDNLHLSEFSPAIDQAPDVGVTDDIDGETRPLDAGFDIGADEFSLEGGILIYPESFPGLTLQEAHDDGRLEPGDTLFVSDYGPNNPFEGLNNSKGLTVRPIGGPFSIFGGQNSDLGGNELVLNHRGGRIEGFVIEMDYTNITGGRNVVFAGDDGGTFANCTFRIAGTWGDGSLVNIGGGSPVASVRFQNCTFEQVASNDPGTGDGALLRVQDGYDPVFDECTFGGRGRDDRKVALLVGGSATFNDCTFDNDDDTGVTIFLEGAGQACNLNRCLFRNPTNRTLNFLLQLGGGGAAGTATFNCRQSRFHAPVGSAYPQTRLLLQGRDDGVVNFENCLILWDATTGQPDGAILFENHSNGLLSFKHSTVVDLGPLPNGRLIELRNATNGTIEFRNSIFDGHVAGEAGLGLVFGNESSPSSGMNYNSSDNFRHDITQPLEGFESNAMLEGMTGFTFADPLLEDDNIHLPFNSPAVNVAPGIGISSDIDGEGRPGVTVPPSDLFDAGADEFTGALRPFTFPDDFPDALTIQDAINDARLSKGDTLIVTGGPYFNGFNNDKALTIVGDADGDGGGAVAAGGAGGVGAGEQSSQVLIFADSDDAYTCPTDDCPLILNRRGGTIENFIFEADGTFVNFCHRMCFGGDDGGTWRNCTFRITGRWPCDHNALDITGAPTLGDLADTKVLVENCVMEQTATEFSDQGTSALVRVTDRYHPVLNNCTIGGRGRADRWSVLLINASADFNSCLFDTHAGAVPDTGIYIFLEGDGQVCNLNDCLYTNDDQAYVFFFMHLGAGGPAGPAAFNLRRTRLHAPVSITEPPGGGVPTDRARLLLLQRNEGAAIFENCSIWWNANIDVGGFPDGVILFENFSDMDLAFIHCTVVDFGPLSNGRFIQTQDARDGLISFVNSIFTGRVGGDGLGLGLVYDNPARPSSEIFYTTIDSIRYDITDVPDEFVGLGNQEGMEGFTFIDPLLDADGVHLTPQSPAINAGGNVGLNVDIDGDARPIQTAFDLGCDEREGGATGSEFIRGDTDASGVVDISDPLNNLSFQFLGTFTPPCMDAADTDDSGAVDLSDPLNNLSFLFLGAFDIPAPGPENCGIDPTPEEPELGCVSFAPCEAGG